MYFPLALLSVLGKIGTLVPTPYRLYVGMCQNGDHIGLSFDDPESMALLAAAVVTVASMLVTSIIGVLYLGLGLRLAPVGSFGMVALEVCLSLLFLISLDERGCVPGPATFLAFAMSAGWLLLGTWTLSSIDNGTVKRESRKTLFVEETKDFMGRLIF